ncbi:alpha/beta hydrolase [Membranihabitans marinus]|uniref:alpha/beta hydrolase n=1 Tax=Membranihabitans marinus TaxID=1227546 RepID=UPI001F25D19D|nr:alpha/beta hydrolase family protein [Membranihabitans marinus]
MRKSKFFLHSVISGLILLFAFNSSYSTDLIPQPPIENSKIFESLKLKSNILGRDVSYSVYMPADYFISDRSYPVLYLLHGYTDDETGWTQFGNVQHIADEAIQNGNASSMIIVMPDAGVSWYINSADGEELYEDFFIKELIPHIESEFRVRSKREFRAVAGLSMGGFGSMVYGLKYPDIFASCAPLSAAFFTDEEAQNMDESKWDKMLGQPFGAGLKGSDRLNGNYKNYHYKKLIADYSKSKYNNVKFYIDCGDDDFLIQGNMKLKAALTNTGVKHEFRVRDGSHSWSYWRSALPQVLSFVSNSFHR